MSRGYNTVMSSPYLLPLAILLGWAAGAVVNYLSDVLPRKRKIVPPFCLKCGRPLSYRNYLLWPRQCPHCGRRRRWRVYLVEGIGLAAGAWLWLSPPPLLGFVLGILLLIYFGVIIVIDMEHRLILRPTSLAGAVLGLCLGIYLHGWSGGSYSFVKGLVSTLAGGAAGYGIMLAFYYLGIVFARVAGRIRKEPVDEEALGFGDVNLGGVLGLLVGWPAIIACILLGFLFGALMGLLYMLMRLLSRRFSWFDPFPYGPSLVASAILLLYFPRFISSLLGQ